MAGVTKNLYELAQSETTTISGVAEEVRIDLNLEPSQHLHGGTIQGTVTNEQSEVIEDAVVKIMDSNYDPLEHTITGPDGRYVFTQFNPGSDYHLFVSAVGYELASLDPFTLNQDQTLTKDVTLVQDTSSILSFIAGDVTDDNDNPIDGAVVQLFKVENSVETLVGLVFTNEFGQYVFSELENGNYSIRISAIGYQATKTDVSITAPSSVTKVVSHLIVDPVVSKGTVSGIITDELDQPVVGAEVILYRVEDDQSLTPVALTRTIAGGVYLFVNTAPGNYKVKSTKTTITV